MKIKEVIVVEGKSDTKRLKQFFDVDTIETNGLGINNEIIAYINEVNNKRGVILLLDPDNPGEKIRKILNDKIKNLKNAFIIEDKARNKNKLGIEYASYEAIKEALDNIINYSNQYDNLNYMHLYQLGLIGKEDAKDKRKIIADYFHLGNTNGKTLLKRLNMLNINYEEIKKVLDDRIN